MRYQPWDRPVGGGVEVVAVMPESVSIKGLGILQRVLAASDPPRQYRRDNKGKSETHIKLQWVIDSGMIGTKEMSEKQRRGVRNFAGHNR